MTSAIGRIFAELNVPFYHVLRLRRRIGDGNLTSIEESMFPLVLNYEILWINNKTIIAFGFRMIWRIMGISKGVIPQGRKTAEHPPWSA